MLEAEPESNVEPFEDFVSPQTKLELIKCFLHAVCLPLHRKAFTWPPYIFTVSVIQR